MLARIVSIIAPPLCAACGGDAAPAPPLCRGCRAEMARPGGGLVLPELGAWAAFSYDGPAGALVRALKFGGRVQLADVMAAHVAAGAPPGLLTGGLVPVPLHPSRLRRRGFNPAAVLAGALARRAGLVVADCLRRTGDPTPQMGRGRRARMLGVADNVRVAGAVPQRALLVDDVVTTGATLTACARALRAGGCREVAAVVYARTPAR
jgi:ComF family protein